MSRRALRWTTLAAVVVLAIELGATYASLTGPPLSLVDGWGATRPTDWLAFVPVLVGGGVLVAWRRYPVGATTVATLAYCAFILRDYGFGMTLPPMLMIYTVAAYGGRRLTALAAALTSLAASLVWVSNRAAPVDESGVALLIWVAFGTVLAVFFLVPLLLGEIVRARRMLRQATGEPPVVLARRTSS